MSVKDSSHLWFRTTYELYLTENSIMYEVIYLYTVLLIPWSRRRSGKPAENSKLVWVNYNSNPHCLCILDRREEKPKDVQERL